MDFTRTPSQPGHSDLSPLTLIVAFVKVVVLVVFLAVGLKLTFWAVEIVDQLLHRPEEVRILQPLLKDDASTERSLTVERTAEGVTLRDQSTLSLFLLVLLLLVLFGAVGRAIGAMFTGAVRLLISIDFKKPQGKDADSAHS
jgi:hypothetical protein